MAVGEVEVGMVSGEENEIGLSSEAIGENKIRLALVVVEKCEIRFREVEDPTLGLELPCDEKVGLSNPSYLKTIQK